MTPINKRLKIVLDTNVLLVSIPSHSKYHWIFQKLIKKEFNLFITNDILKEYEEILYRKYIPETVENVIEILLLANNVKKIIPYFHWNLIDADKDDNKFVDYAIAGNADYLVTNDKHFNVLMEVDFPRIKVITIAEFQKISGK